MTRSNRFQPGEQPFHGNGAFQIDHDSTKGPVRWLAPTQTTLSYSGSDAKSNNDRRRSYGTLRQNQNDQPDDGAAQVHGRHRPSNVDYKWTSRNSRKGRHALLVGERSMGHEVDYAVEPTNGLMPTLNGLWRMLSRFPCDDLSYLTALALVGGCLLLVVCAFLSILPKLDPRIQLSPEGVIAQAGLTFLGCTLFLTSSLLSYLEAVHSNKEGCFGWSAEQTAPASSGNNEDLGLGETTRLVPDNDCSGHYNHRSTNESSGKVSDESGRFEENQGQSHKRAGMRMFPSLHEVRSSYIYDLGFIACLILLASSVVYWIASLATLVVTIVGIQTAPWVRVLQLVAALGFAGASLIFALETQDHWAVPAPHVLGWHIGAWNFVGSCGFALFAAFALAADEASQSSSSLHYFWGCWGFLIGSAIQWYESLDKHPVERKTRSS